MISAHCECINTPLYRDVRSKGTELITKTLSPPPPQVVGSQARILYSNEEGRIAVALSFNKAVADGRLKVRVGSHDSHVTCLDLMT